MMPTETRPSTDCPPSYETAQVGFTPDSKSPVGDVKPKPADEQPTEQPLVPYSSSLMGPSGSYALAPSPPYAPSPNVYHYVHQETGEHVASLLPPDHPEMVCLQQGHDPVTQYGPLGIVAAILWFPLGIGLCLLDRKVKCKRCDHYISHSMCD